MKRLRLIGALALLVLAVIVVYNNTRPQRKHRSLWTAFQSVGVDPFAFTTTCGGDRPVAIPEVSGIGLALLDIDGDGHLEVFIANGATLDAPEEGPGCRLFTAPPDITDITRRAGIDIHRWATSATPFDLEGDGDTDLYVTCIGANVLLRNDDGVFTDITNEAGVGDEGWATCAAPGDVNGDGWTDLYVVNYLHWDFDASLPKPSTFMGTDVLAGPRGLPPQQDRLYLNNGDGTFTDATDSSGLAALEPSYGLNAVITDFTGDGQQDILVANDTMANLLLTRAAGEAFTMHDIASDVGLSTNADGGAQATMGLAIGDVNGDGAPDVFSTNFSSDTNTLHVSNGSGFWSDRTQAYGLGLQSRPNLGWTTFFMDLDWDGDEDLFILNGHVYQQATMETMDSTYAQTPQRLDREGDRFMLKKSRSMWGETPAVHRVGVKGTLDLDHSGDFFLATASRNGPIELLRLRGLGNRSPGTYLLEDDRPGIGNREGHGAHLEFHHGTEVHHRWITTSSPFQGADPAQVHVCLDWPQGSPATCFVDWPDGQRTRHDIKPNQHVTVLRRSEGTLIPPLPTP